MSSYKKQSCEYFVCEECGHRTSDEKPMQQHMSTAHPTNSKMVKLNEFHMINLYHFNTEEEALRHIADRSTGFYATSIAWEGPGWYTNVGGQYMLAKYSLEDFEYEVEQAKRDVEDSEGVLEDARKSLEEAKKALRDAGVME